MDFREIEINCIVSAPFEENSFIVRKKSEKNCFVVDPGFEPDRIIAFIEQNELTPTAFLITHGHSDHIAGNEALKGRWPDCPLVIGQGDADKLADPRLNLSADFGAKLISPKADITVEDGQTFDTAGFALEVLEIPGHSRGHVVYHWAGQSGQGGEDPEVVFVGDVIFNGSIGRTDFADGNFQDLADGIHKKLFTLPDNTVLFPGHGPSTTVEREKTMNPFVGLRA